MRSRLYAGLTPVAMPRHVRLASLYRGTRTERTMTLRATVSFDGRQRPLTSRAYCAIFFCSPTDSRCRSARHISCSRFRRIGKPVQNRCGPAAVSDIVREHQIAATGMCLADAPGRPMLVVASQKTCLNPTPSDGACVGRSGLANADTTPQYTRLSGHREGHRPARGRPWRPDAGARRVGGRGRHARAGSGPRR